MFLLRLSDHISCMPPYAVRGTLMATADIPSACLEPVSYQSLTCSVSGNLLVSNTELVCGCVRACECVLCVTPCVSRCVLCLISTVRLPWLVIHVNVIKVRRPNWV